VGDLRLLALLLGLRLVVGDLADHAGDGRTEQALDHLCGYLLVRERLAMRRLSRLDGQAGGAATCPRAARRAGASSWITTASLATVVRRRSAGACEVRAVTTAEHDKYSS
jgi:hypothetical protein